MNAMTVRVKEGVYRTSLPKHITTGMLLEHAEEAVFVITIDELGVLGVTYPETSTLEGLMVFEFAGWSDRGYPRPGNLLGAITLEDGFVHLPTKVAPENRPCPPGDAVMHSRN